MAGVIAELTGISQATGRLWKALQQLQPTDQVTSIEFSEAAGFPGQRVEFGPFTIISGLHGSGKSSLLGYIAECLYRETVHPDNPPFYGHGMTRSRQGRPSLGGECAVTLRRGTRRIEYTVDLSAPVNGDGFRDRTPPEILESGDRIIPYIFNPSNLSAEIGTFFEAFRITQLDYEDVGKPEPQKRRDIDALRDILGISYDEVHYIPVKADRLAPVWPYVKARRGQVWVDSHSMSHGELCVHFMRWALMHPYGEVVLLDEPEANIAPRGHGALLDEIARLALSLKCQVVIATHSAAFLSRVPLDWVRICLRPSLEPMVITPDRASDLRDVLGIENPLKAVIVVEDEVAVQVVKMILSTHRFLLTSEVEIIAAGSWTDVLITAKALSNSRRIASVAVLDGDQRGRVSSDSGIFCLPGREPPEKVFFRFAFSRPSAMAERLGCSDTSMRVYLAELAGLEHHRWLTVLSRRTGQDWLHCLRAVFDIWHGEPLHRDECETLTRRIEIAVADSNG